MDYKIRYNINMKATMIIKNIGKLYTCDRKFTILSDAFVALHHDKIIDFGTHCLKDWLDPATAVIDARGEMVTPAFIDSCYTGIVHDRAGDQIRQNRQALHEMQQHGILTCMTKNASLCQSTLTQDVICYKENPSTKIIDFDQISTNEIPGSFLLSCGFGACKSFIYDLHVPAFFLHECKGISGKELLMAMTANPAKAFGLKDRGVIAKGKIGDLLVLQEKDIDTYFQTMGRQPIHRMLKNGIQFYPHWIVC